MDIRLAFAIIIIGTLLFFWLILKQLWITRESKCTKLDINKDRAFKKPMVLDLRNCNIGVSCEEYTLLIVVNPKDIPVVVRERMSQHIESCVYHNSNAFHQSVLGIMVDSDLEKSAMKIIEKYDLGAGAIELKKEGGQILYTT